MGTQHYDPSAESKLNKIIKCIGNEIKAVPCAVEDLSRRKVDKIKNSFHVYFDVYKTIKF